VFERTLYRRLSSATHFDPGVLFSIGLAFMSIDRTRFLPAPSSNRRSARLPAWPDPPAGLDMGVYRLFLIVLGLAIAFGLQRLVSSTRFGAQLRASADNPRRHGASASTWSAFSPSPSRWERRWPAWVARWE
jgi:branched-chain amino acid transport system permease protein